jgi:uncharacterized protein (TIGR02145 family)
MLLFALVSICLLTIGQPVTIELTFTAVDSAAHVRLDSVLIMNRTQGGETTIHWPDTAISLEITPGDLLLYVGHATPVFVGVPGHVTGLQSFHLFQNFPNPVSDQSLVHLFIPEKGSVNLMITDLQGRVVLSLDRQLDQGQHTFRFHPGDGHIYFLTASWNGTSRSIKILTTQTLKGQRCRLEYMETSSLSPSLKVAHQISNPAIQKSGILDAPESDKSYVFQFASSIPCPGTPLVSYEGRLYNTLQVLSQCWLKENLSVGTMIQGTIEQSNNRTFEKYCYEDNPANCDTYGGLYQWNEAMQYSTGQLAKGICPPGWHLPMDEEWKVLEGAADGQYGFADPEWDGEGYRGYNIGSSLKEEGTAHWNPPNYGATNASRFTGLPGGYRDYSTGGFANVGAGGSFWSSTEQVTGSGWYRALNFASPHSYRKYVDKAAGYSIRCLKGCAPVKAFAGTNNTSCVDVEYTLSDATAANFTSLFWTSSGTGSFDDPTLLNPSYTPGQEDLTMAEVILTLSASGGGECPDAQSVMTLTIMAPPTAYAGEDADMCSTQSSFSVNGNANNHSSVLWTTGGTGIFDNPSSLNTAYIPSLQDKTSGLVALTLTSNGNSSCAPVSDELTLRIWTGTANAGPDQIRYQVTSTTLEGNAPTFGTGIWEIVSGTLGQIMEPDNPTSQFIGLMNNTYLLTWTISNQVCGTSVDMVQIRFEDCGYVMDYEGYSYPTVEIGDQCWMAKNLNVGNMILNDVDVEDNGVVEKYCYNNVPINCDTYGGLYPWNEAMQYVLTEGAQGICPSGWHIPSDNEWKILEGTVDSQFPVGDPEWDKFNQYRGYDVGGNLKEAGTSHWWEPNQGATNSSGFTGLPSGLFDYYGSVFDHMGTYTWFWTSTNYNMDDAWFRLLGYIDATSYRSHAYKVVGCSVRCLRDD